MVKNNSTPRRGKSSNLIKRFGLPLAFAGASLIALTGCASYTPETARTITQQELREQLGGEPKGVKNESEDGSYSTRIYREKGVVNGPALCVAFPKGGTNITASSWLTGTEKGTFDNYKQAQGHCEEILGAEFQSPTYRIITNRAEDLRIIHPEVIQTSPQGVNNGIEYQVTRNMCDYHINVNPGIKLDQGGGGDGGDAGSGGSGGGDGGGGSG